MERTMRPQRLHDRKTNNECRVKDGGLAWTLWKFLENCDVTTRMMS